jgi:uncharacterized RDD family membrane protein YckC
MSTFGDEPTSTPPGGELPDHPGGTGGGFGAPPAGGFDGPSGGGFGGPAGGGFAAPAGDPYGTGYGTPQGGPPPGALAGFWIRFGAALLDGLLIGLIAGIFGRAGSAGNAGVQFLLGGAYFIFFHSTKNGQSLGQKVCGIRLVDSATGGQVNPGAAAVRFLMSYVSGLALLIGYLWMLWDPMKQTWHDKVANTLVVYTRVVPAPSESLVER